MQAAQHLCDPRRILVVEDDPDIAHLVQMNLTDHFEYVQIASDGIEGFTLATEQRWDLIVLDLRLPGKDGLALCRDLRDRENTVPILMLTSKSSEADRVAGLEVGADDYLTKPFSVLELVARIKAIFRRQAMQTTTPVTAVNNHEISSNLQHDITLNLRQNTVRKGQQELHLTAKEFDLLCYFVQNPDKVFSRAHLLQRIWGQGQEGYEHTVNSHINRLRAKIEDDPTQPKVIVTVWGVGYRLGR